MGETIEAKSVFSGIMCVDIIDHPLLKSMYCELAPVVFVSQSTFVR